MKFLERPALLLLVKDTNKSYGLYSKIPGFIISYSTNNFTTFTLDEN
ncbi:MAG: hypothetical protein H0X03_09430 [Nitrosopumilus sp.]|nr:hypothetical protein [Nitrosopumilus sp.]